MKHLSANNQLFWHDRGLVSCSEACTLIPSLLVTYRLFNYKLHWLARLACNLAALAKISLLLVLTEAGMQAKWAQKRSQRREGKLLGSCRPLSRIEY